MFFLFFSGAAGGEFDRWARAAPLKNKKKEGAAALVLQTGHPYGV
jgi:hypothetical protein